MLLLGLTLIMGTLGGAMAYCLYLTHRLNKELTAIEKEKRFEKSNSRREEAQAEKLVKHAGGWRRTKQQENE